MQKTKATKKSEIRRQWHLIDAQGIILGRLATKVAKLLLGKHKPYYTPHLDVGDKVVIINATEIAVTGGKKEKKEYFRHSGYPGGLKRETLGELLEKKPEEAIRRAIWGMLPKNKLRKKRMRNLYIYKDAEHPHGEVDKLISE